LCFGRCDGDRIAQPAKVIDGTLRPCKQRTLEN
jgi:hypothetical protein